MSYGQDSSNAVYPDNEDYYPSTTEPQEGQSVEQNNEQNPQPGFDPNKYVEKADYDNLKQQLDALQPQVQDIQRIKEAFNPQQKQDPQIEALNQLIKTEAEKLVKEQLAPYQQTQQAMVDQQLEGISKNLGFPRASAAQHWVYAVHDELHHKGISGDASAGQIANQIAQKINNQDWLGVANFVQNNWDSINSHAGVYSRQRPVQAQNIGQSFSNNSFQGQSSEPSLEQLQQKAQEVRFTDPQEYAKVMSQMRKKAFGE